MSPSLRRHRESVGVPTAAIRLHVPWCLWVLFWGLPPGRGARLAPPLDLGRAHEVTAAMSVS